MQRLHTTRWLSMRGVVFACLAGALVAGCSTGRAFQRGSQAAMRGDWDEAVAGYAAAVQAQPNRVDYRMALERAQMAAAQIHFDKARDLERRDQLDASLSEYRKVVEYQAGNQEARAKVAALEQTIRDRVEASRPRPAIEGMREKARKAPVEPLLNPKSKEPIDFSSRGQLRDILIGMGGAAGITVNFDRDFQEKTYSVELKDISFEQALQQVTAANQLFYKVIGDRSIIVIPDNPAKRQSYEEQAVQTFYLSHADPTELMTLINTVIRVQQAIQPVIAAGKTNNTILARASVPMLQIIERIIEANDKPRAEIVIDVEILEVNRNRAKQYGLELSQYAVGMTFSPESAPGGSSTSGTAGASTGSFNLNTVSKGVSTNDFYASVPTGLVHFLESDINTKVIAKPQLRGTEGEQLSLNLGEELPVPSTTFTPIVSGGTAVNPMTSFQYKPVGVNVEMKPRVTYDGDVIIDLKLEVSAQGPDKNIAGQNLPSFTSRKVGTKLRLRDGESNLLAGLLREDERTSLKGVPGILRIPILSQLFGSNDNSASQTDIVMLLTPHIVRTHELTQKDFMPIYIGSQQNLGISGAPPSIGQAAEPEAPATKPAAAASPSGALVPGSVVPGPPGSPVTAVVPQGSSPIPGTVGITPPPPPPTVTPQPAPPPPEAAAATPATQNAPAAPAQAPAVAAQPAAASSAAPAARADSQMRVLVGAPTTPMMVAGGPYTVPLAISGAARVSTITLSLSFNPRVLRVRLAQEGDFMRKAGAKVTLTHKVDETAGRIDFTLTRQGDADGASGDGVLAGIIFDAIGAGSSTLSVAGVATAPGGSVLPLQFVPATVTVR